MSVVYKKALAFKKKYPLFSYNSSRHRRRFIFSCCVFKNSIKDKEYIDSLVKKEQEVDNLDEDILYSEEDSVYLDTFTFLYQMLDHMTLNREYIHGNIEEYKNIAYEKFDEIGPNTFTYLGNTVIYGKDGNIIGQINVGNYQYVEIENVSKWVHLGYISVEDKRFRVHNGIDYKALARAGVSLIKNKGNITQGGSTITQQVLKNNLLTQEKTFKRKLVEFFLAPEFEKKTFFIPVFVQSISACVPLPAPGAPNKIRFMQRLRD